MWPGYHWIDITGRLTTRGGAKTPFVRANVGWVRGVAAGAVVSASAGCADEAPPATYADVVLADRPSSYWRFGETDVASGARDETGRAQATATAGVTRGTAGALAGDPNTAFAFDGVLGSVVAPDLYTFAGRSPFSVEVWVAPSPGGLPFQRLCNHRYGTPHTGWLLFLDPQKRATFERWSGNQLLGAVSAPLAAGVYAHVVATYDGAALSLYVNGALAQTTRDAREIAPFTAPLVWGAASTDVIDFFSGRLDEGAIYDHALSPDRIARHHAAGAGE